jgi:hypothetical protein
MKKIKKTAPPICKPSVRLAAIYINPDAARRLKTVGDIERRSMTMQAAYIIEMWAQDESA